MSGPASFLALLASLLTLLLGTFSMGGAPGNAGAPPVPTFAPLTPAAAPLVPGPNPGAAAPGSPGAVAPGSLGTAGDPFGGGAPSQDSLPGSESSDPSGSCGGDVALVGDSITAAAGYRQEIEAACPGGRFTVYAASGRTTSQMLAGFSEVMAGGHGAVVILGGVNNIDGDAGVRSDLGSMYSQASRAGWKVVAATVLPYKGYSTWTAARGAKVRAVNDWIRQQGADAVADGFAAMGDPSDPDALRQGESGDRLHPNAAGYRRLGPVIAQAIASAG